MCVLLWVKTILLHFLCFNSFLYLINFLWFPLLLQYLNLMVSHADQLSLSFSYSGLFSYFHPSFIIVCSFVFSFCFLFFSPKWALMSKVVRSSCSFSSPVSSSSGWLGIFDSSKFSNLSTQSCSPSIYLNFFLFLLWFIMHFWTF